MEQKPQTPISLDWSALASMVTDLKGAVASTKDLTTRVSTLEQKPSAVDASGNPIVVDLAPINGRLDAIESALTAL